MFGFISKIIKYVFDTGSRSTLKKAEKAIINLYAQGRLTFKNDNVVYTEKDGNKEEYSLDDCASLFWSKLNEELANKQQGANFAVLNIEPNDIKEIILKVKETKQ
ncbi:MAG: hypothetical protein PHS93_10270 [Candidatus Omnitrophica bacterium]|nr:hypothetical protein [Candidatus Omnitrophota bacterium]